MTFHNETTFGRTSQASRTSWPSTTYQRVLAGLRTERRLADLPARCLAFSMGLDNDEADATLLFAGLPYPDVMDMALRVPVVREAVASLPAGWSGWSA